VGNRRQQFIPIPYGGELDQALLAFPTIPGTGSIRDKFNNYPAQLVEQPAGISAGAGTLTFSEDIDSVDSFEKAGAGTATINGGDAKQLDLSADTFWDIQLTVNGKSVRIPDPYTGYDINGNYHGTPADITSGTQDSSAIIQSVGFNRYIQQSVDNAADPTILSNHLLGTWTFDLLYGYAGRQDVYLWEDSDNYIAFHFHGSDHIGIAVCEAGVKTERLDTGIEAVAGTLYKCTVELQADGDMIMTVNGTEYTANYDFTGVVPIEVRLNFRVGSMISTIRFEDVNGNGYAISDLIDDWHDPESGHIDWIVPADLSNIGYDVLGAGLHYPASAGIKPLGAIDFKPTDGENLLKDLDFTSGWTGTHDDSDSFTTAGAGGMRRNDIVEVGKSYLCQVTGSTSSSALKIYNYGTTVVHKNLGTASFNEIFTIENATVTGFYFRNDAAGTTDIDEVILVEIEVEQLEIFNRLNILDEDTEFFKSYMLTISSMNPTYPYRHQLSEIFANDPNDYWKILGLQNLCNRLFWQEEEVDGVVIGTKTILNYGTELTSTQKAKVENYLKEVAKTNLATWNLFKAGTVVAAYRFDKKMSCINNDGDPALLGWEGEELDSGSLTIGNKYRITAQDGEDFTADGAPDNNVGTVFVATGTNVTLDANDKVVEMGDTVNTVLDVGSGGLDGQTYYPLTQSNLTLQWKRIPGGIDSIDDNHYMEIDSGLDGYTATVIELDGTEVDTFLIGATGSGKIYGSDINGAIGSYQFKAIKITATP